MKASRGEIKIHEILEAAGLSFEEEYIFNDLKTTSGRPLRFDFCVFDDEGNIDFLIEYNGIQHYEAKSKFRGKTGLCRQRYNDNLKYEYCKKHKYTLVIIPYWDEYKVDYDYIINAAYGGGENNS